MEDPPPRTDVGCPSCGRKVTLPAELPSQAMDTPAEPIVGESKQQPYVPFDFQAEEPLPGTRPGSRRRIRPAAGARSRQQLQRGRRTRSLIAMLIGMAVLVAAVVLLSRWSQH